MRELREEREMELRRRGGDRWEADRNCYVERRLFERRVALPAQEKCMISRAWRREWLFGEV